VNHIILFSSVKVVNIEFGLAITVRHFVTTVRHFSAKQQQKPFYICLIKTNNNNLKQIKMRTEILKKGVVVVKGVLGFLVGFALYYLVKMLIG
jgi:ankyrin repeat protein